MLPPFAAPGFGPAAEPAHLEMLPSIQEFLDELPSIDDFIDSRAIELPPIANFLADDSAPARAPDPNGFQQEQYDADGWALTGWQDFDWTGAANLGARSQAMDDANSAWDTIDWNVPARESQSSRGANTSPSADEVARALDGIARRIRSGELLIDQVSATPPEAAMAAALATLLRMRD